MDRYDSGGFYVYAESRKDPSQMEDVRKCPSGAVRDNSTGKGRMDLLPGHALIRLQKIVGEDVHWPDATLELAKVFENGALHYADRNWEQGMYVDWFVDSGQRHLEKALAGWHDEPHLFMALWNLVCLVDTVERVQKGELEEEYLGHFKNLKNSVEVPKVDRLSLLSRGTSTLLYIVKYNLYNILTNGRAERAYYAAVNLFEVADRFARAVRTNKSGDLGILTKLFNKEGACVQRTE